MTTPGKTVFAGRLRFTDTHDKKDEGQRT